VQALVKQYLVDAERRRLSEEAADEAATMGGASRAFSGGDITHGGVGAAYVMGRQPNTPGEGGSEAVGDNRIFVDRPSYIDLAAAHEADTQEDEPPASGATAMKDRPRLVDVSAQTPG
jgi:hypothetical protein